MTKSRWALSAVVLAAVVVLVAFLVGRYGDDPDSTSSSAATPGASAAPSASADAPAPKATATPDGQGTQKPTQGKNNDPAKGAPRDVGIDEAARIDRGADARIVSLEAVTSKAEGPGEISAPAVRVTVEVTAGDRAVGVSDVSVNAYYGEDLVPAIPMTRPGSDPFGGTVKAGTTARGVYVFNIPKKQRDNVTIEMFYAADRPAVRFRGAV